MPLTFVDTDNEGLGLDDLASRDFAGVDGVVDWTWADDVSTFGSFDNLKGVKAGAAGLRDVVPNNVEDLGGWGLGASNESWEIGCED